MASLTPEETAAMQEVLNNALGGAPTGSSSGSGGSWFDSILSTGGDLLGSAWDWLGTSDGLTAGAGVLGGGLATLLAGDNKPTPTGYQGGIPDLTYNREQISRPVDPNRRPGSAGRRYFTDGTFTPTGQQGANQTQPGIPSVPAGGGNYSASMPAPNINETQPGSPSPPPGGGGGGGGIANVRPEDIQMFSQGGLASLNKGRHLRGNTNGMADKVDANIDGVEPAKLSHGEYVFPADVVAYLGGGNTDAGVAELDKMIAGIRKDAIGSDKQIKQIDPNKHLMS